MKKTIIILTLLFSSISFSQEAGTIDCSAGIGFLTTDHIAEGFASLMGGLVLDNEEKTANTPAFNATFKYAVAKNWFLNADGVYQLTKYNILDNKKRVVGDKTNSYYTIGLGTEYHYVNEESLQVYSGLSVGRTFIKMKSVRYVVDGKETNDNLPHNNVQINLIGARLGKKLAGTVELGFGYKGIFNFGVSYQP